MGCLGQQEAQSGIIYSVRTKLKKATAGESRGEQTMLHCLRKSLTRLISCDIRLYCCHTRDEQALFLNVSAQSLSRSRALTFACASNRRRSCLFLAASAAPCRHTAPWPHSKRDHLSPYSNLAPAHRPQSPRWDTQGCVVWMRPSGACCIE